jgi:hypothetical protein
MQTKDFIYKNLEFFIEDEKEILSLNNSFSIGSIFEEPLNRVFKKNRFVETSKFDFEQLKGSIEAPFKKPDYKIVYAEYRSPYYALWKKYGAGGLEIKVHLASSRGNSTYEPKDKYELFKKLKASGFKWGVALTLYKGNEIREWCCTIR